jgi:hypothetical protein
MPYYADLRSSYAHSELNIAWFYEALREMGKEIKFDEDAIEDKFREFIDDAFNRWITYKIFNHIKNDKEHIDRYESVWEFLHDQAILFETDNAGILITNEEEEESD